tara:strand:+ start:855 stop:1124 length:270 start_codon:yes stop_codon:yes gene_type:complete
MISFSTKNNKTKIIVLVPNGSKFTLEYPINLLLDVDLILLIKSKNILSLHNNIINIINSYNLSLECNFEVKEFLKWVMYSLNIAHIQLQ